MTPESPVGVRQKSVEPANRRARAGMPPAKGTVLAAVLLAWLAGDTTRGVARTAEDMAAAAQPVATARVAPIDRALRAELARLRRTRVPELFHHVDDGGRLTSNYAREHAQARWLVYVDQAKLERKALLDARTVQLRLLPDLLIAASRRHFEDRGRFGHSWLGRVDGDPNGAIILTQVRNGVGAWVSHASGNYLVIPLHGGFHEVMRLDGGAFPAGHGDEEDLPIKSPTGADGARLPLPLIRAVREEPRVITAILTAQARDPELNLQPMIEDGSVIDVLTVYTPYALREAWWVAASETEFALDPLDPAAPPDPALLHLLTQMGLNLANLSFLNSGIPTWLNLVTAPIETDYAEAFLLGGWVPAHRIAADLAGDGDGEMDEVHALRDEHAADVVVLLTGALRTVGGATVCGRTQAMRRAYSAAVWPDAMDYEEAQSINAFAAVDLSCTPGLTLGHEVGHMMGARHDRFAVDDVLENDSRWETDGFGYVLRHPTEPRAVRTVMSYSDECDAEGGHFDCRQIPRWSNPDDFSHFGLPLGIADGFAGAADNRRVLTKHRVGVSRYRWWGCRLVYCAP